MPKIIDNLRQRLVDEARQQVQRDGYGGMTVRSVAAGCGVGVGTVYNYFPSKDALMAAVMLADWAHCIETIDKTAEHAPEPETVVRSIYDQLRLYAQEHGAIFSDADAASDYALAAGRYHGRLRDQLARPLHRFCGDDFTASFIAEALLTWTVAGKSFSEIYSVIQKLF